MRALLRYEISLLIFRDQIEVVPHLRMNSESDRGKFSPTVIWQYIQPGLYSEKTLECSWQNW